MSRLSDSADYQWLRSAEALKSKISEWKNAPCLAIDTEFVRENTYYAEAGLIQLADHGAVYLIDPLELTDLSPLAEILDHDDCIKVMHSMSEDIELLYHLTGTAPKRILDTQVAAAFLGYGPSLGYQGLVEKVLGIELDKGETRSDWLKRPLSDSQIHYAAKDAEYLITLYDSLVPKLEAANLKEAVLDECGFTVSQSVSSWEDDTKSYLKLRGAWDLPINKQCLLQELVSWRDQTAKQKNIPKPWVFSDAQLIDALRYDVSSIQALRRIDKVKPKSIRLFGDILLEIIDSFHQGQVEVDASFIKIDKPIRGKELDAYKRLKKVIQKAERETHIAAQLLGSRKMLENVVIHMLRKGNPDLPADYLGWRKAYVGEGLKQAIQS